MNTFTPAQINELLIAAKPGATVYLVGAGGCGMSGLGHLLLDLGYAVSGSDLAVSTEVQELQARGATIHQGHSAEHLALAEPALVVYSSAVRLHNPELELAQRMQIPVVRRAVLLAALLRRQSGVCIAGMHGKTTTTAMLSFALENLQANPSYAIGALVPQLRRHARFSAGGQALRSLPPAPMPPPQSHPAHGQGLFVIEADESDGTLREFEPDYAIVLNVDEEHLDFYANLEAICSTFRQFTDQTHKTVFFCADDLALTQLLAGRPKTISFGFSAQADYRLVPEPQASTSRKNGFEIRNKFAVWKGNEKLGDFSISLMGVQNISNAGAVIAFLDDQGFPPEAIAAAIAPFTGAMRRQQQLYRDARFCVFEDYGHHPAEIAATLRAFKLMVPGRLLVAFQPHRFTRTRFLLKQFTTCFSDANCLWVTEIYAASEPAMSGINGALLAKAIQDGGQDVQFIATLDDLRAAIRAEMKPGDLVLFLGAGDITNAANALAQQLRDETLNSSEQACSDSAL